MLREVEGLPDSIPIQPLSLAEAYAMLDEPEKARALLPEPETLGLGYITIRVAGIHAELGDLDTCFAILEKAYEARNIWLPRINCTRYIYDLLHDDPRFVSLVERMGFEPS